MTLTQVDGEVTHGQEWLTALEAHHRFRSKAPAPYDF